MCINPPARINKAECGADPKSLRQGFVSIYSEHLSDLDTGINLLQFQSRQTKRSIKWGNRHDRRIMQENCLRNHSLQQSKFDPAPSRKMAKRSREDLEPSCPGSDRPGETETSVRLVLHPSTVAHPPLTSSKIRHLDPESGEAQPAFEMICSLPPHRQTLSFANYEEYEVHYLKVHTNRCTECRKNFPTEHFLNLHIEENHDSLVSVRKERGEKTVSFNFFNPVFCLYSYLYLCLLLVCLLC
jgi:hypothetical protein